MGVSFKWLGHSTFQMLIDGHEIVVDPFLTDNPLGAVSADTLNPEVILLSHAHGDHVGDVMNVARRTGATVTCNFEMGNYYLDQGLENVIQVNPGGTYDFGFMRAKWTLAFHSSSFPDGTYGGQPNGIIITSSSGVKLYFAGDTALFSDMKLIGDEGIDVAFLPIGDHFTMGISDSIKATNFVRPRLVVPMHYNTWPPIVQNASEWAQRIHEETRATPIVLDPGGEYKVG